jgi:hypothetical protein
MTIYTVDLPMRNPRWIVNKKAKNSRSVDKNKITFFDVWRVHKVPRLNTVAMAHISGRRTPGFTRSSPPAFVILKGG